MLYVAAFMRETIGYHMAFDLYRQRRLIISAQHVLSLVVLFLSVVVSRVSFAFESLINAQGTVANEPQNVQVSNSSVIGNPWNSTPQ
jgi:hypothetical protein